MSVISCNQFIIPPDPAQELAPVTTSAAGPAAPLARIFDRFQRWDELSARARTRLLRDGSIVLGLTAGLSHGQISSAVGLTRSRVTEILGDYRGEAG